MKVLLVLTAAILISSCASDRISSDCSSRISRLQAALDAANAKLDTASTAAEKESTPQMFGKVAGAAADVAGATAELSSAKQGCGVAP